MYIYNVTTNIQESVHDQWLQWMKETHIPEVLATGKFSSAKMCKVLVEEDMGGITYSVQFTTPDKETLESYYVEDAPRLRQDVITRFPGKFVSFRTELEIISDHYSEKRSATNYLFAYGTLQDESVHQTFFSRKPVGIPARLSNYKISNKKIANAHPNITYTGDSEDTVIGMAYLLTHEELLIADDYEGAAYERVQVLLTSGKKAWVYVSPHCE